MRKIVLLLLISITFVNASVIELTDQNFESKIKESNQTVVMFHAPWCGACKQMRPNYNKVSETFKGRVQFASIDTDKERKTSRDYGIKNLPTTIFFKNGKEIRREVGSLDSDEIEMFLDPIKALQEQDKKCIGGNSSSCIDLAGFYKKNRDYHKTVAYYKKACLFDADGCSYVGDIYYNGKIVQKDFLQAFKFYKKACSGGDVYGCNSVGYMYYRGEGALKDLNKSIIFYRKACDGKDTWGCYNLGHSYEDGEGVKQDYSNAMYYYKLACDSYFSYDISGSANACNQIGQLYRNGNGVKRDYSKAFHYYEKSCSKHNYIGCSNLGDMYRDGKGIDKNITKAIQLYENSCREDESSACRDLGDLYYENENYDKAKEYFEQACNNDNSYGCYSLGYMYEYGYGSLSIDDTKALIYYKKGCSLGNKVACEAITDLKKWDEYADIFGIVFALIFSLLFIFLHYRQKRVVLENKEFNVKKEVPFLFSWTMFLFGFWVPLLRADFIWAIALFVLSIVTGGLISIITAFFYNKMYIKSLLTQGYEPADEESKALLDSKNIKYKFNSTERE